MLHLNKYESKYLVFVQFIVVVIVLAAPERVCAGKSKVLDINEKLPELIKNHPDKSWLVKFYAPWCYHCQQLEPTYNNVAERIYQDHSNLVVGRLDCTKHGRVCENYGVDSYPTIIFINKDSNIKYQGAGSEPSIISFAERLQGPDINVVYDCKKLKEAANKHGLVVLSTFLDQKNELRKIFEALAKTHKSNYWFYQYTGTCEDYIQKEGLYLLKRNLNQPLRFPDSKRNQDDSLREYLIRWLNAESFPVYGRVTYQNIERSLKPGKLLVMAVLDEYKPARRLTASSYKFHKYFEKLAYKHAQHDKQLLFGWSSDPKLIEYITITPVKTPNVIILRADYSYHLIIDSGNDTKNQDISTTDIPDKLHDNYIRSQITLAKSGELAFKGGSDYSYTILRHILGNFNKFMTMYRANPLLVSLIFGFPCLIVIFVIYTTCFYDGSDTSEEGELSNDEEDDEIEEEERQLLRNSHRKQD